MKFDNWISFENIAKIQISVKSDKNNGYFIWVLYMKPNKYFSLYLTHFLSKWETFHTKVVWKIKTYILCSPFFFENRTVYEIMWKYSVEWSRPQMTIWRMPFECWIPKATNTYSGCVILIAFSSTTTVALTRLKLRCTDFASLVRHEDHNHTHRHVDRLTLKSPN